MYWVYSTQRLKPIQLKDKSQNQTTTTISGVKAIAPHAFVETWMVLMDVVSSLYMQLACHREEAAGEPTSFPPAQ